MKNKLFFRAIATLLCVMVMFSTFPISFGTFAETISSERIFTDDFSDDSFTASNWQAVVTSAYNGDYLKTNDEASYTTTEDGRTVLRARDGGNNNNNVGDVLKNKPTDRRIESVTATFKQSRELSNEDSSAGITAFHINSRNSLVLCVFPSSANDYIYYSWCRYSYRETGASNTKNNCVEIYNDQVTNAKKWRYSTGLVGDNTSWLTVTLTYDYSQIEDNILTVSATLKDAEGNEGTIPAFSAKFDDTVYNCTDADGNVTESAAYLTYDENFKVGIASSATNYYCYYDNFSVQYSKTNADIAEEFKQKYAEELAYTSINSKSEFDALAKISVELSAQAQVVKDLLSVESAKIENLLTSYSITTEDFEYENLFNEVWETIPYSGDIHTWNPSNSIFYTTTESIQTTPAVLTEDTLDSTNTVLSPEIRDQHRKRKLLTIKEKYLKQGAQILSFSTDFRLDVDGGWDSNSGIYYYYKDPYNWGRIEFKIYNNLVQARLTQSSGSATGENMVITSLMNATSLTGSTLNTWITVQVDYDYLDDGTNLTFTFTDKATGTAYVTKTYKTTDFNEGGRVGFGSGYGATTVMCYDNFSVTYSKNAKEFRENNKDTLAYTSIDSNAQFDAVMASMKELDSLPKIAKAELTAEKEHLAKLIESYYISTDDFEYENLFSEVWESLPETGDIMTWSSNDSDFIKGTSMSGTPAHILKDTLDSTNNVLSPEYRNQSRKRKILTLKEDYLVPNGEIASFSTDFRMDLNMSWDSSPGIYYYYKDVYNWARIELYSSSGVTSLRWFEQAGTSSGEEMVNILRVGTTKLSDSGTGVWFNINIEYTYSETGTTIKFTVTEKESKTVVATKEISSEYIIGTDFKVGYGSANYTTNPACFDNFELTYYQTAEEFRKAYADVLSLTTSTIKVEDVSAVCAVMEAYERTTPSVKAALSKEYILLKRLYNKALELKILNTVYLSATGDDANDGTQNAPVATLDKAYQWVKDGGTISIIGTYTLEQNFVWNNHGKTVTITGGTLDGSALKNGLILNEDVTFKNITLQFDAKDYIYANGHKLVMGENIVITNAINLFGGGTSGTTVESTDLKVLSGSYVAIYGGSNKGTVTGDTNVYIGGNVNSAICTALNHENVANFYGGGYGGTVGGNTNVIFTDNALSSFVVGGGSSSDVVEGDTNVEMSGNAASYGIYGGAKDASTINGNINIVMKSGSVADLFGASGGAGYTGNVNIQVLGGKIVRRLYGGCYNNVGLSGLSISWSTSYYVNGNITVFLSSNANITLDGIDSQTGSQYDDRSLYARSRQYNLSSTEKTYLVYENKAAYDKFNSKNGPQDSTMTKIMKNSILGIGTVRSASDNIYYCSYAANGATINQSFTKVSGSVPASGTVTVSIDSSVPTEYTKQPIEAAKIVKNDTWVGPVPEISYSNNVEVGIATASITSNGVTASTTFVITDDLTPAILGASISKSKTQDIRFTCQFALTNKKVEEYGAIIVYYNHITEGKVTLDDMTVDSNNKYVIKGSVALATPVSKSGEVFYANIGSVPETRYGYRYVARVFVKYEGDDTYYYSTGGNGSIEKAEGIENGYACRSVINISKSIISWVYENYEAMDDEFGVEDISKIISGKNPETGKLIWAAGVTSNNGEKILAYLNENAEEISRAIVALKN